MYCGSRSFGEGENHDGYKGGGDEGTGIGSWGTLVVVNGGASTGPTCTSAEVLML